jgi:hypothetical protein
MKMTILEMNEKLKFLKTIDKTMYSFKVFRLPRQSKRFNNKRISPPLQILQGNLRDFFITAD